MHANKIKTAIPSKKEKQKTTRFKTTATKLAKNQSMYFVPYRNYNTNKRNYGNRVETNGNKTQNKDNDKVNDKTTNKYKLILQQQ